MTRLNVLLLVWDACRLDYAREHAPTLASLGNESLWFENAITAAGHSLSSHVSMMTGTYPSEHGIFHQQHMIDELPLLDDLNDAGYTRYGVSANGFASPMYGFDDGFDEFYNTQGQMVFPEGLDVHRYGRTVREENEGEFDADSVSYTDLLRATLRHERPLRSGVNVAAAGLSELVGSKPVLQRIPHPRFSPISEFCYSPEKNTQRIQSILERESDSDSPFFLFANYMDTHHPYAPPEQYQRQYCGRTLPFRELSDLNERAHPWTYFEALEAGDQPDEAFHETIRDLYAGEVRSADDHLRQILEVLDREGMREETLIVVTADHGENLGETDRMGETRMGHVASASEHMLRVPLVVAHPELPGDDIEQHVSLRRLRSLLRPGNLEGGSPGRDALLQDDGTVASQVPVLNGETICDRYPRVPEETVRRQLSVMYRDGWKIVVGSNGDEVAWLDGEQRKVDDTPEELVGGCRRNLRALVQQGTGERELSSSERAHLEALGYL
ncbi:MAG: sulfatase-like hydrolase/transferase [Halovenus sp.]